MHEVVIVGELLAIAAILVSLGFVDRRHGPARAPVAHDSRDRALPLADVDAHLGRNRA